MVFGKVRASFDELFAKIIGKTCPPADQLFARFDPSPEELKVIESSVSVVGRAYLKILATRIFLGVSSGHFSNVLVKKDGELVSLDHVSGKFEPGDDLEMLFRFVSNDSLVFEVLCEIAKLTEGDIRAAVAGIPKHEACGSTDGLADYFVGRLKLFQKLCSAPQPKGAAEAVAA